MPKVPAQNEPTPTPKQKGNIDLSKWKVRHRNGDGSISTILSMSFGTDDGEILVPTFSPQGKKLSPDQAIEQYRVTGKHLGKFHTPEEANTFAEALHQKEADKVAKETKLKIRRVG